MFGSILHLPLQILKDRTFKFNMVRFTMFSCGHRLFFSVYWVAFVFLVAKLNFCKFVFYLLKSSKGCVFCCFCTNRIIKGGVSKGLKLTLLHIGSILEVCLDVSHSCASHWRHPRSMFGCVTLLCSTMEAS